MKARHLMQMTVLVSAIGMGGSALAADAAKTTTQMQNTPSGTMQNKNNNMGTAPAGVGGSERMDNTNNTNFDSWLNTHATTHNGRITRQEFMDQMGSRWDRLDAQRQGYLSPDQARGIYMPGQSARPAMTGSDVTPGYNGPGSTKGK